MAASSNRRKRTARDDDGAAGGRAKRTRAEAAGRQQAEEEEEEECSQVGELIGRDTEVESIRTFVNGCLESGTGSSLYVCGSTGTGKTASVMLVASEITRGAGRGGKRKARWAMLNGNTFSAAGRVFVALAEAFGAPRVTDAESARKALDRMLVGKLTKQNTVPKSAPLFLAVVDEIDQLLRGACREEVLYQLFEWANRKNSRFCLVGIANAVDLHERFLPNLEQLGYAPQVLVYSAYNKDQLAAILDHKVTRDAAELGVVVDPVALELCARKIAAKSGDLRKGLEICKQALLQARAKAEEEAPASAVETSVKVTVAHMSAVMNAVLGSSHVRTIQSLPNQVQFALIALARIDRRLRKGATKGSARGGESVSAVSERAASSVRVVRLTADKAFECYRDMMREWGLPSVAQGDFASSLLEQLAQVGLVSLSQTGLGHRTPAPKNTVIKLCVAAEDVKFALENSTAMRQLLSGKSNRRTGQTNMYRAA